MNVYQKLAKARAELKSQPLKQSGKNKGVGYTYFELGDFLPEITRIENEIGIVSCVSFGTETATLTVYNTDDGNDFIIFSSPMSTANLKGCHEVQNLGAVETYLRRYLYNIAYEIVECDGIDGGGEREEKGTDNRQPQEPQQQSEQPASEEKTFLKNYKCSVCGKPVHDKLGLVTARKYGAWLCSPECVDKFTDGGENPF